MNSAENVSLKPCPFCGGEGHLSFYSSTTVECLSCDAAMEGLYSTPELAIAAWNLRSPPTEDADRVEAIAWLRNTKMSGEPEYGLSEPNAEGSFPVYAYPRPETVGVTQEAGFLIDRLDDFENGSLGDTIEDACRDFDGHVSPAIERLRAALSPQEGE